MIVPKRQILALPKIVIRIQYPTSLIAPARPTGIVLLHNPVFDAETEQLPWFNKNLGWLRVIRMVIGFPLLEMPAVGIKHNLGTLENPDAVIFIESTETVAAARGLQVASFEKKHTAFRNRGMLVNQVVENELGSMPPMDQVVGADRITVGDSSLILHPKVPGRRKGIGKG
jgi:hypothetical protein